MKTTFSCLCISLVFTILVLASYAQVDMTGVVTIWLLDE